MPNCPYVKLLAVSYKGTLTCHSNNFVFTSCKNSFPKCYCAENPLHAMAKVESSQMGALSHRKVEIE